MAPPKWKYAKEKAKSSYDTYLRFEDGVEKKVKVKFFKFKKSEINDSLFNCTVLEEDGQECDKIWTVWDVDLRDELKKKFKTFNPNKTLIEVVLTKRIVDEEEEFELKSVTKVTQ